MNEKLNNTGVLIEGLSELQQKAVIALYELAGFDAYTAYCNDVAYVGDINPIKEIKPITLHQLAFESGLNPEWADDLVYDAGCFYWDSIRSYSPLNDKNKFNKSETTTSGETIIKKQPSWPESEERINNIGTNGNNGEHYKEVGEPIKNTKEECDRLIERHSLSKCLDKIEQHGNYYDIVVKGKYDTGYAVIDPYRLFPALSKRLEPEVEHAVKKLLYAGQRGAKDYNKDIDEAIWSLNALKERLK